MSIKLIVQKGLFCDLQNGTYVQKLRLPQIKKEYLKYLFANLLFLTIKFSPIKSTSLHRFINFLNDLIAFSDDSRKCAFSKLPHFQLSDLYGENEVILKMS